MDLSALDTVSACNKGAEIEIKHPITNVGVGVFITILGKDSDAFREHSRESGNAYLRREAVKDSNPEAVPVRTMEQIEKQNLETLAVCTIGWRTGDVPTITLDGTDLPFTPANASKLYNRFPSIYRQVDKAIGTLENFMPV